jgi:excisionase family DNA binding protein
MDELLTIDEVARYCKVHKATVRRHIASGRLRSVRVGRAVRVRKEDVDQFVGARAEPPTDDEHRPFTLDDPFWEFVGSIDDPDGVDWISRDKRRALAEAYSARS